MAIVLVCENVRSYSRIPLAFTADPTLTLRGVNRSEFEWVLDEVMNEFGWAITEDGIDEDVHQAMDWWYTPWPFYDNGLYNKIALSNVGT